MGLMRVMRCLLERQGDAVLEMQSGILCKAGGPPGSLEKLRGVLFPAAVSSGVGPLIGGSLTARGQRVPQAMQLILVVLSAAAVTLPWRQKSASDSA